VVGGTLAELVVDEKHRITLPRALRKRYGITSGSKLEVEERGSVITIRPVVPVKSPTETLWGIARGIRERNPKWKARQAIGKRKRLNG
jgi:AbrB family looped-hinge helix DNA binding protein